MADPTTDPSKDKPLACEPIAPMPSPSNKAIAPIHDESEAKIYAVRIAVLLFVDLHPVVQHVAIAEFRRACFGLIRADVERNSCHRDHLSQAEAAVTADIGDVKP